MLHTPEAQSELSRHGSPSSLGPPMPGHSSGSASPVSIMPPSAMLSPSSHPPASEAKKRRAHAIGSFGACMRIGSAPGVSAAIVGGHAGFPRARDLAEPDHAVGARLSARAVEVTRVVRTVDDLRAGAHRAAGPRRGREL